MPFFASDVPVEADIPATSVLRLDGVSKKFGDGTVRRLALNNVTITFDAGTLTAIAGPSGSGKTTLLSIAGGLETPTSGSVVLAGQVITEMTPSQRTAHRARTAAYIFQEYNLIRTMTVLENVCLPLELAGTRTRLAKARAVEALDAVGTAQYAGKFPDQISGGEQQRVAIARAMVDVRPLLLADEPTGALDSANGQRVIDLLKQLAKTGVVCVVATHNPEVMDAADRVVHMRDGHVLEDGP